jgi:hypothetical protein
MYPFCIQYSSSTKALGKYHINKSASNYRKVRDGLAKFSFNSPCSFQFNLPFRVVLRPREWGWVSCPLARAPDAGLEPESNLVCPEGSLTVVYWKTLPAFEVKALNIYFYMIFISRDFDCYQKLSYDLETIMELFMY